MGVLKIMGPGKWGPVRDLVRVEGGSVESDGGESERRGTKGNEGGSERSGGRGWFAAPFSGISAIPIGVVRVGLAPLPVLCLGLGGDAAAD